MENEKPNVKEDKSENKGCIVTLLMIFLVGFGSCAGTGLIIAIPGMFMDVYNDRKNKQFIQKVKTKVENNQATATDYYLFANMIDSYEICKEIGIEESDSDELYLDYLQQAIAKGSQEAKLDYAQFLFTTNYDISDKDLNDKEKQAKYLKLKQALVLTEEVFNTQCIIYEKPYYRKFYAYPENTVSARFNYDRDLLDRAKQKNIKSNFPELYQLAQKAEKTYEKNCIKR
ncbi:MAG: hypothetical protein KGV51_05635 [Moraxellaceae bacterium]|nr:hypothetical protein [Moraxellaceae bacterium]